MSLSPLSLSIMTGVQGFPFRAAVIGLSAGTVVNITNDATPGMGYANGFISHQKLPYDINGVGLTETIPGTAVSLTTHVVVTALNPYFGYYGIVAPKPQSATVPSRSGIVFGVGRSPPSGSVYALAAGSDPNLSISAAGVITAAAAIGLGVTQTAIVRETFNQLADEYPVVLTGGG